MPSKMIIVLRQFMFFGIIMFWTPLWTPLSAHFNPLLTAQASRARNIFMPATINSNELINNFQTTELAAYARHPKVFSSPALSNRRLE